MCALFPNLNLEKQMNIPFDISEKFEILGYGKQNTCYTYPNINSIFKDILVKCGPIKMSTLNICLPKVSSSEHWVYKILVSVCVRRFVDLSCKSCISHLW